MTLYAEVLLPLPLGHGFTYTVPSAFHGKVKAGSRVLVPFKESMLTGFVVKLRRKKPGKKLALRDILEVLDESPLFSPGFLAFTQKLSKAYLSSWGEILQASLPHAFLPRTETRVFLKKEGKEAHQEKDLSRVEQEILTLLKKREYSTVFLRRRLKIKNFSHFLTRLEKKGWIQVKKTIKKAAPEKKKEAPSTKPTQLEIDFSLEESSLNLATKILQRWKKNPISCFLLHGGSAKREAVYFYLIKKVLEKGRRILFLVPEISLTESLIKKFEKRLGEKVACLHSRLSERKRESEWKRIRQGEVDVVVGSRSALLSPLSGTGLIIVDEEQDESYFQRESPTYDARKGAWLRAKEEGCALIYGSAFPSVEAFFRARRRGEVLHLGDDGLKPKVDLVDERKEREIISEGLKRSISQRLEKREPVLVFINRRGYASFLYCPTCNYIPRCPRCKISLTYHKKEGKLLCHYCSHTIPKVDSCPVCGKKIMGMRGMGIEVVEEELGKNFPQYRVVSFNTDVAKTRKEQEKILNRFRQGKIDILVGTQLLAHQVDLPSVSLVVIFYPETTLSLSDFKATQKTYQNLIQMMRFVLGEKGKIKVKTAFPQHFAIRCAARWDYLCFFRQEIRYRRLMNYPPFCYMAEVLFRGDSLKTLARKTREFYSSLRDQSQKIEVLGPARALGPGMGGKGMIQVILKSARRKNLEDVLLRSLQPVRMRRSILFYE
jgi:primosomal protein N' (replication factor Y)